MGNKEDERKEEEEEEERGGNQSFVFTPSVKRGKENED